MKNIFKIFLFNIMCFMFIGNVSADAFKKENGTTDIYKNCNSDNHCVPLCIYKNKDGVETGIIGFFYNAKPDEKKWMLNYNCSVGDYDRICTAFDVRVPFNDIYWDGVNYDDGWRFSTGYNDLVNDLKCPSYMYYDTSNDKMCLSNSSESCRNLTNFNIFNEPNFNLENNVFSSFRKEFDIISEDIYNEVYFLDDVDKQVKEKVDFIFELDSNLKYDDTISVEENVKNNCSDFKTNVENIDSYTKRLVNSTYAINYSNTLTKLFEDKVNSTYLKNHGIYNYDSLKNLMIYVREDDTDKIIRYRNKFFEKLDGNSLIADKINASYKYISFICSTVGVDIEYDEQSLKKEFKNAYDLKFHSDLGIDLSVGNYDCGFLSGVIGIIKTGYFVIELITVILLIALSILDYSNIILSGETDEMKKSNKKFVKRVVITVVIFLLPAILNFVLGIFKIEGVNSKNPLCWKVDSNEEK